MPPSTVDGALRLRAWALEVLCSPAPAPPVPEATPAAWEAFLRAERIALPLGAALEAAAPSPGHAEVARRRATTETQRALSARAAIHRLRGLARDAGLTVAVLKGGVPLMRGVLADVADVDVLASPADAEALAAAIDRMGYAEVGPAGAHALRLRAAEQALPVEIHTSLTGGWGEPLRRLRPAPGGAGLHLLHPADHLWFVLHHGVEQHAERRGALRDLVVLADAVRACSHEERGEVDGRVARHTRPELFRLALRMADAVAARAGAPEDAFRLDAAGRLVLAEWLGRAPWTGALGGLLAQSATTAVAGRTPFPRRLGEAALELPSGYPLLAWLRRRAPRVERAVRVALRTVPSWPLYPAGALAARSAERAVRRTRDG